MYFANINNGYIVGNDGTIFNSNDGGRTWKIQDSGTDENLKYVFLQILLQVMQ